MKHVFLTLWAVLAERTTAPEVELNAIASRPGLDTSYLLAGISALADRQYAVAAVGFRKFADQLERIADALEDQEDV